MTETFKLKIPFRTDKDNSGKKKPDHLKPEGSLGRYYGFMVLLPLLMVFVGAGFFWHFVSFAFLSNMELNGLILIVMLWGSFTMVMHVRRVYHEDRIFHAGMAWLKLGAWSDQPSPSVGPQAFVLGMLGRLEKLGLGHQLYIQNAAMVPELDALEQFFEKKQELSQFIVGLMVGLGLLGTFIGLLETLIATSSLIATIANSVGGSGGGMESEFARIVGGLQKPLTAMGTAFSASMFGLIGSIMLGFQMLIVRKSANDFAEHVREEVLSLAEKTKIKNSNLQITERFLATLLADILEQHKETSAHLQLMSKMLLELVSEVKNASLSSLQLHSTMHSQGDVLERTVAALGSVRDVVPLLGQLANASSHVFEESHQTSQTVQSILEILPEQSKTLQELSISLKEVESLAREVGVVKQITTDLVNEIKVQGMIVKRLDATLWNQQVTGLQHELEGRPDGKSV